MNNLQTEKQLVLLSRLRQTVLPTLCYADMYFWIFFGGKKNLLQPNLHNLQEKESETKQKIYVDSER